MTGAPRIFIVAGEPSGDALGARLMAALAEETGGRATFTGIGGDGMASEGLTSLFPMRELSVMGLVEVLPHLRRLHGRLGQAVAAARDARPDAVVTIDSPGFTLRLQQRLADLGVPRVHYVAPQVWAWKPWRARTLSAKVDHLLALLPFEPPLFEAHGLPTTFVGHPAVERTATLAPSDGVKARPRPAEARRVCVLPGSRAGEVRRLLPVFGETIARLAQTFPGLTAAVPTVSGVAAQVRAACTRWPVPTDIITREGEKRVAFADCDVALAASGTVAAELAVAGTPTVVAYRMNPITGFLARRLVRTPYVSLPNIVLGREVQPEYLLDACTADNLAPALARLLADGTARERARVEGREAAACLGAEGPPPSRRAARAILATLGTGGA